MKQKKTEVFILIQLNGKYAQAYIMCDETMEKSMVEEVAKSQVRMICDNEVSQGAKIRVMPDVHPGKVGPIGLTMTVGKKILPSLVGIDIGCGMLAVKLDKIRNDFMKLDTVIRDNVPVGFALRKDVHAYADRIELNNLKCFSHIRSEKALLSLGTLGGGNHFIELDVAKNGEVYLIVHTGSRHLGKEVAEYYMKAGQDELKGKGINDIPFEMTYLSGYLMEDYLHDLKIVEEYAILNRKIIAAEIIKKMKWKVIEEISCSHNYVDFSGNQPILRKGAISAKFDEKVIIPINMKEGVLLGRGLGNEEWNNSAPHGSGRVLSRGEVNSSHTVSEFKKEMKGIYTSCISKDTLDEAPFAYRGIDYIKEVIKDTVEVENVLTSIFNYKGGARK